MASKKSVADIAAEEEARMRAHLSLSASARSRKNNATPQLPPVATLSVTATSVRKSIRKSRMRATGSSTRKSRYGGAAHTLAKEDEAAEAKAKRRLEERRRRDEEFQREQREREQRRLEREQQRVAREKEAKKEERRRQREREEREEERARLERLRDRERKKGSTESSVSSNAPHTDTSTVSDTSGTDTKKAIDAVKAKTLSASAASIESAANADGAERWKRRYEKLSGQLEEERQERSRLESTLTSERSAKRAELNDLKAQLADVQHIIERDAKTKKRLQTQVEELSAAVAQQSSVGSGIGGAQSQLRRMQRTLDEAVEEAQRQRARAEAVEKELQALRRAQARSVRASRRPDAQLTESLGALLRTSVSVRGGTRISAYGGGGSGSGAAEADSDASVASPVRTSGSGRGSETSSARGSQVMGKLMLDTHFKEMQAKLQREKEAFQAEMERIEAEANERALEREAAEKAREERRERERKMLAQLQLDAEKSAEKARERMQKEIGELRRQLVSVRSEAEAAAEKAQRDELTLRRQYEEKLGARERVLKERSAANARLEEKNARLESSLQRLRLADASVSTEMEAERREQQRLVDAAEARVAKLSDENEELRNQLLSMEGDSNQQGTKLSRALAELAETQEELRSRTEYWEEKVREKGAELREERERRWACEAELDAVNEELARLQFYFLSEEERDEERREKRAPKNKEVPDLAFAERMRRERTEELQAIKRLVSHDDDIRKLSVEEAQAALVEALERLLPSVKDQHAAALAELLGVMELLGYTGRTKMVICLALTRFRVPIQLIMELIEMAEHVVERGQLAALDTPEGVIARLLGEHYRALSRGRTHVRFSEDLCEELVRLRARRTGKSIEASREEIMEALADVED